MPKKYHNPTFSKPASSAHPALAASPPSKYGSNNSDTTSPSVNDLINHLRRSQVTSNGPRHEVIPTRTVHPSLKGILQVADTPPPRPRPGMRRVGGRSVRGPPGPAPPKSWLTSSIHAPKHLRDRARVAAAQRAAPDRLDRLPGSNIPDKSSLLHHCLKAIARDWKWHVEYDQYYLATMPVTVKDTELHGATGSEEIKHLDLAGSVGQSITFKQLEQYFANCTSTPEHPPPPSQAPATDEIDSWEAEADTILSQPLHTSRFPNLTHLSLSHPSPTTSWPRFLAFAPHLATLTHLSLAYWPTPCLTPNAKTTTTSSKYSPSVSYGCSNFYSASEGDWSEAAGVLMRLSRATYCLKWLDLEGCGEWLAALKWEGESGGGVEWCGGWRGMETVRVHAGWIPEDMVSLTVCDEREGGKGTKTQYHTPEGAESLGWDVEDERRKYHMRQDVIAWQQVHTEARAVEAWVRSKRRLIGGLRITFEDDRERIK